MGWRIHPIQPYPNPFEVEVPAAVDPTQGPRICTKAKTPQLPATQRLARPPGFRR